MRGLVTTENDDARRNCSTSMKKCPQYADAVHQAVYCRNAETAESVCYEVTYQKIDSACRRESACLQSLEQWSMMEPRPTIAAMLSLGSGLPPVSP